MLEKKEIKLNDTKNKVDDLPEKIYTSSTTLEFWNVSNKSPIFKPQKEKVSNRYILLFTYREK